MITLLRKFFTIGQLLLLLSVSLGDLRETNSWAAESPKTQIRACLMQGIEKGFDLDERGASADLMKAVEADKENPLGFSFLALSHLFFYEMSFDEKKREREQESVLRFVSESLAKGEKRLGKNPKDGEALFAMAVAQLVKVRLDITRKNYFATLRGAQTTREYLEKANDAEPENFDISFVLGLLDYHIGQLSGLTRFLSSLFVTSGDPKKGLQELKIAAQKGYFFKDLAKAELLSAYANFEKQPERALPLARELNEKFPHNYNILFALANVLSELGRSEEAFSVAREIENGIKSRTPPFRPELWPRHSQIMGKIYFDKGEYAQASEYFLRSLQDLSPYNARVRAWALVRLGMIHDVRQERNLAEEYYQKALETESGEGAAQIAARQYLKTPYSPPHPK
jgi:tetratricopeptide (TPR) repeat protein